MTRFRGSNIGCLFQIFTILSLLSKPLLGALFYAVCIMNVDLFTVRIGLPIGKICLLPKNTLLYIFSRETDVLNSSFISDPTVYKVLSLYTYRRSFKNFKVIYVVRTS